MGLRAWLEERAATSSLAQRLRERLAGPLPRPAVWSVALGAALLTLVAVQAATGSLLALYYKPSWDRAHASVESILTTIPLGWLVRSLHVWGAHLILVATLAHLVRTFWRSHYRKPRELTWMVMVLLLGVAAGAAITGQLLALDEEAYGGALVASDFAGLVPGMGKLVRGGDGVGEFMLGRFFVAHVMWLPAFGMLLIAVHLALVARHGMAAAGPTGPAGPTALEGACLAALGTIGMLALLAVLLPAGLGPAANPTEAREGIRPLWLFLPVYQAVKYLPAGAVAAGGAALFVGALALPLVERRWLRIVLAAAFVVLVLLGTAGGLAHRTVGGFVFDTHAIPHRPH